MKNTEDLRELVEAGLLTTEQAQSINDYWATKPSVGSQRLLVVFSLLGALLVGLGIILVVAHNWDQLGRLAKTTLAFIPVLLGQAAAWYSLRRKPESASWREGSGVFLLLAIGACLAMVSQIYHIEGELRDFLLSWIWLALPIMYILDSALASLLFWVGITWYAGETNYWSYPDLIAWKYWLFAALALPYYFLLRRRRPHSNYQMFHDWAIPLSFTLALGTLADGSPAYMWLAYHVMLILFYVLGKYLLEQRGRILSNGWLVVGLLGSIGMLLAQSFREVWSEIPAAWEVKSWQGAEFFVYLILNLSLVGILLRLYLREEREWITNPLCYLGIFIFVYYWIGWENNLTGAVLANVLLLGIGLYHIFLGTRRDHLGILNFGLLIITFQIIFRFFDTDMSFAMRGFLFLLLGGAFFAANSYLIKQRKKQEA